MQGKELYKDPRLQLSQIQTCNRGWLETMHFDEGFSNAVLYEEVGDLGTLVSLQLDDLAFLGIVDNIAIASKFLR